MLAILAVVIVVLAITVFTLLPKQEQAKTVSVPTEIKSQSEAATLEKDTSSILNEAGDAMNNIDSSLPDV